MSFMLSILAAAAAAQAPAVPPEVSLVAEGHALALRSAANSLPLYTYDKDEPGKSNCIERCLAAWPALAAKADSVPVGKWSVIARPDGSPQWAYEGKPVYTFVQDAAGVAKGDGMGGVWHLLPSQPAH